ncbi:MAG: hypothetical protein EXS00_01575 [Phycisphaerales bacterium]|nr:hypothetical protein [Phycisphaerales bacterium]
MQSQIQITVSAGTLISIKPKGPRVVPVVRPRKGDAKPSAKGKKQVTPPLIEPAPIALEDLPAFARDTFGFTGMTVPVGLLAGKTFSDLERLRDRADRAACPFLVLIDNFPIPFVTDPKAAIARVGKLSAAALRLGCGDFAVVIDGVKDEATMAQCVNTAKRALGEIERQQITMLLQPASGLTGDAARLCDLIKQIGGFRIGAMPSFAQAASGPDMMASLRRLAPYSRCIEASVLGFARNGKHRQFDLAAAVQAVMGVGYEGTLCLNYLGDTNAQKVIETARQILLSAISTELVIDDDDDELIEKLSASAAGIDTADPDELMGEEPEGNGD